MKKRRPNVYPEVWPSTARRQHSQIPDHLWIPLRLALAANPKNARTILRDFCVMFGISMDDVASRAEEEAEALNCERTLH